MKLQAANLCVECDELHDKQQCPSCGSTASYPIARSIRPLDERVRRAVEMGTEIATGGERTTAEPGAGA